MLYFIILFIEVLSKTILSIPPRIGKLVTETIEKITMQKISFIVYYEQ